MTIVCVDNTPIMLQSLNVLVVQELLFRAW